MLKILKGVFLAAFAGCCWGSMAVAAQYLFTNCGFEARHLTTLRLIGAGVLLLALQAAFGGFQSILKPFKEKRNIRDVLIYGVGVLLIQYTFFLAIEQSNAGTAAIMVGVGRIFGDLQTSKTCPQRILLSLSGYKRSFFGRYQRKFRVSGFCFYRSILGLAVIRFRGFLHCTA